MIDIAGNGTGDTRWKVPGVLDWNSMTHNPICGHHQGHHDALRQRPRRVPVSGGRYPSDRGGTPAGWIAGFVFPGILLLEQRSREQDARHRIVLSARGVHEPQPLGRRELSRKSLSGIPNLPPSALRTRRLPRWTRFANSSPGPFIAGIKAARERIVARNDDDRESFLRKRGFSKSETAKIVETVLREEGRPPESLFDFVQGITALARGKAHQDARLELEGRAKRLLERA